MSGSRRAHLAILSTLVFGCDAASSLLLDLYANEVIVKPNESITCGAEVECVPNTCSVGRICIRRGSKLVQYGIITCDEKEGTPYCNNGSCSKDPRPECAASSSQFVCPETDGVYPDPSSCTRYHICANRVVTTNVCPPNNVYNHEERGCKYRRLTSDCVTVSCSRTKLSHAFVHPRDDRIYGRCVLGKPFILGRCKDYQRYDLDKGECVRHCRATGVQPPDPNEPVACGKYVQCAEISPRKYIPVVLSCACNEGYDEKENRCTKNAECLKNISDPCKKVGEDGNSKGDDDGNSGGQPGDDNKGNDATNDNTDEARSAKGSPLIINNSGSNNGNNNVANGDDDVNGNLVNGNNNGGNSNSGNVDDRGSSPSSQIINNSGNSNSDNNVSNGDDRVNGNLVNGNGNGNNNNSGNVGRPISSPLIINNSGNNNDNNSVTNGNDNVNGNLVNGNNNGDNRESGNVQRRSVSPIDNFIINNSGNNNGKNDVSNGDDSVDGNIVNGNDNGDNTNSGNVKNESPGVPPASPPIDNSIGNDSDGNEASKGTDGNVADENDNDNNNDNSDNTGTSEPIAENPENKKRINFLRIIIDWIIRITVGEPPAR